MIWVGLGLAVVAAVRGMWSPCGLSMLTSLNPVAERGRGHRFWVTASWYVAGGAVGGALLGAGCSVLALAAPPPRVAWCMALAAAVVGVASDSALVPWRLPDHPRQVDERWLTTYRRWIYAGGYGVQIGAGFTTYVMTAAVYVTAVLAVLTGSPSRAFAVCLVFGAVRGLVIVVAATARTPQRLRALLARVDGWDAASLRVAGAAQAGVAAAAVAVLGAPVWLVIVVTAALLAAAVARPAVGACSAARGHDDVHEPHLLQHGRS